MRRILSISIVLALLSSSFLPLMASTGCMEAGKTMSCHGGEVPQCDRHVHEHHHHEAAPAESASSLTVAEDNTKCPMDCCSPGHVTSVASPAASSLLPPLAVSDPNFHFASIAFVSAGFSSHTDRGPPLA
jgi:hypothetical protein